MIMRLQQVLGRTAPRTLTLVTVLMIMSSSAEAQTRSLESDRPLPHPSVTFTVRNSDFEQTSEEVALTDLDFSALTWGVVLMAPAEWRFTGQLLIAYGGQSADEKKLLEAELLAWARIALGAPSRTEISILFPVFFSYRRLDVPASPTTDDVLGVFRFGIGLGLGIASRIGSRAVLSIRMTPLVTLTANSTQSESLLPRADGMADGTVLLHLERVLGNRVGVTIGGQIRVQRISIVSEEFFPDAPDSWIAFRSVELGVLLGINW